MMRLTLMRGIALTVACVVLAGCGAWQSTKNATSATASAIFVAKVTTMNLELHGRAELNRDARSVSLPVVVRIYQLKDGKAFNAATYAQLLHDNGSLLKADVLAREDVTLAPDSSQTLERPMHKDAHAVGVVAFFRDASGPSWRLLIPTSQWKQTDPVRLRLVAHRIVLLNEKEAP